MPDPREDYDYLYQVGENSYAEPWNMRSLFGLQNPRALTSQETVDVTAPRPPANAPYPENIDEIMLGTKTLPPTGTYTPNRTQTTNVDPRLQPAWNELTEKYPFANNLVQNVRAKPLPSSVYGRQANNKEGSTITLNSNKTLTEPQGIPTWIPSTMRHEVTHASQFNQFPNERQNYTQYYGGKRGMFTPYEERQGEILADTVESQASEHEYNNAMKARMAKAEEDYLAGRGPRPNWMYYNNAADERKYNPKFGGKKR